MKRSRIPRLPSYGEPDHIEPQSIATFQLPDDFVESYRDTRPPFGFDGMGYFVYKRTYSRVKPDGSNEEWFETVRRVVEGTFSLQKRHITTTGLGWNEAKATRHAKEMYDRMFQMKFLPPGRGLWAMGSTITEERGLYAALNNCAFVSTQNLPDDLTKPFEFLMDMSMLGVGVGFDVRGAGTLKIHKPHHKNPGLCEVDYCTKGDFNPFDDAEVIEISDDREGWVESLRVLLESYFIPGRRSVLFDYIQIRPGGLPIKGFGGVSSGPEPLIKLHETLREILDAYDGEFIDSTLITDIMNLIGKAVIAGNVRRTAEIVFGDATDEEYMNLKNYEVNPERNHPKTGWGWTSNNSIFAGLGMDYTKSASLTAQNGEPGYSWLQNMREFGRMGDGVNNRDHRAMGGNPCLEQTLEPYELCCLVEANPGAHDSYEDFQRTLKYAYMYAKTVTLGMTHWPETNRVMLRNRRIGTSVTGVAQFADIHGIEELREWLDTGYRFISKLDGIYSDRFAVPRSIKMTSIKPSGTVSKVMGVWAGMHRPDTRYIRRRIRVAKNSPLLTPVIIAGYHVEPSVNDPNTMIVSFPVDYGPGRTNQDVTLWEQVSFASFLQTWWADNQVSCTVSFDAETEGSQIAPALDHFQYTLKGISFLPRFKPGESGAYAQLPEEQITEAQYREMVSKLSTLDLRDVHDNDAIVERFCDGETCLVDFGDGS